MAWTIGPGNITSVSVGPQSIDGGLIEGLSISSAPDTFDAAVGVNVERGSVRKTLSFNALDVSRIAPINTLMTARTPSDVVITYSDASAQTLYDCIVRIKPLISPVTDVQSVWIAADGTANTSIESNFTALGPVLGTPSFTADFAYDGTDGLGRPYYSTCRLDYEVILPGTAAILPYALLVAGPHRGVKNQIAFLMPNNNFVVLTDAYTYFTYADEDGSQPVAVRMRGTATGATWGAIIGYSDGAGSPTNEAWDAAGVTLRFDMFAGMEIECTNFWTDETAGAQWA